MTDEHDGDDHKDDELKGGDRKVDEVRDDEVQDDECDDKSDGELIEAWQENRDMLAMETLCRRHYPLVLRNLRGKVSRAGLDIAIAEDIAQNVFITLCEKLDNFVDDGRFPNYRSTITRNKFIDYLRSIKIDPNTVQIDEDENYTLGGDVDDDPTAYLITRQLVEHLTTVCIPSLPAVERMVYLLQRESEYWEIGKPLEWSQIAQLNGIDKQTAWERFESARRALMKGVKLRNIDPEEILIFLVWTESKRLSKKASHTFEYFAELLGEPEQNLRNRSFQAKKKIKECMNQFVASS